MAEDPARQMHPLSDLWERDLHIREMARSGSSLTRWANNRVVGVASTGAMALNIKVLEILAEWWACQCVLPQAVPINVIRKEASAGKHVMLTWIYFIPCNASQSQVFQN